MSRNGSGVYSLVAGNPVVSGTTITTTWANSTLTDIASALTGSVASDGQTPMSGSLNMANNKVISVTDPTNAQDAATKAYVDLVAGGTKDGSFVNLAYTGTLTGGTGVVNLGSGQFYKDASGNVGIGVTPFVNTLSSGLDLKNGAGLFGYSNNSYLTNNLYYDSAWKYKGTGFGASIIGNSADGAIQFNGTSASGSAGGTATVTERMRIDSSGNVGIGTSSLAARFTVNGGTSTSQIRWAVSNSAYVEEVSTNAAANAYVYKSNDASYHVWKLSSNEAMRIDSSGNLLVGSTTTALTNGGVLAYPGNGANSYLGIGHSSSGTSSSYYAAFNFNGTAIGSITQNGTTAVLYNTTSDYRLKSDVTPIQNALTTIEALNPVSFTWIDGRKDDGFIAHEIQSVIPNCVTGEKDAVEIIDDVDDKGKVIGTKEIPKYQQMDNSGVIPFLVKAIQEQQAMIEELKTKVIALEAK